VLCRVVAHEKRHIADLPSLHVHDAGFSLEAAMMANRAR
jgi:hypothetical protein